MRWLTCCCRNILLNGRRTTRDCGWGAHESWWMCGAHLFGEPEKRVAEEHVFRLTPSTVNQNDIMGCRCEIWGEILQISSSSSRIQKQSVCVLTHGRQLGMSDTTDNMTVRRTCRNSPYDVNQSMCAISYLSSVNRLPINTLHFTGGRHAARSGTVRRTRLSWRKQRRRTLTHGTLLRTAYEVWTHTDDRPRPDAGRCKGTWRRREDA